MSFKFECKISDKVLRDVIVLGEKTNRVRNYGTTRRARCRAASYSVAFTVLPNLTIAWPLIK